MKKQFTIFLILIFVLALMPVNFIEAITQNQINAEVQIVCPDKYGNWYSGSGTIIDPKGIILTNKHIVSDQYGGIIETCFVGFIESIDQEPDFGTQTNPNLAEVKFYTTSSDEDAAILYLDNPTSKSYSYVDIWNSNSDTLQLGEKIEVIGFPSIGGSTITYTSGDFSGFGSIANNTHNYLKTTAPLEHGNSGGASYNSNNQFMGIPTMVIAGTLNSMSYILSIDSIKEWLSDKLGYNYKNEIIQKDVIIQKPSLNVQNDITPPDMQISIGVYSDSSKSKRYNFSNTFQDNSVYAEWTSASDSSGIKGYYVYWGSNINAIPTIEGKFQIERYMSKTFSEKNTYYLIIQAQDNAGNISGRIVLPYNYGVLPDWVENDPLQYGIVTNRPENIYIYDYSQGEKGNLLETVKFDSSRVQGVGVNSNNLYIEWDGVENRNFIVKEKVRLGIGRGWDYPDEEREKQFKETTDSSFIAVDLQVGSVYNFELENLRDEREWGGEYGQLGEWFHVFTLTPTISKKLQTSPISQRLKGKLLLQVQQGGRIWYVNPEDGRRHEVTFANALPLFENFALGIADSDLSKIPLSDDTWTSTTGNRLKGKLLLQVEQGGRIWYIDFDGKRWEVTWANLMDLFRNLALGITDEDLNKISVGSL